MFISLPWYETKTDFNAILDLVPFEESKDAIPYAEWVAKIKQMEEGLSHEGNSPYRVTIKPEAIKAWVQAHDVLLCRASISDYAMKAMAKERFGAE